GPRSVDALPLDVVRIADHGGFRALRMRDERALDLGGAEPVSGHVDHVVDPAGDPVVAVFVAPTAVTGEVLAWVALEVGVDEALMVAIDGAHHAGPGIGDAQVAGCGALLNLAIGVDDLGDHPEERLRRRTGLESGRARQRG